MLDLHSYLLGDEEQEEMGPQPAQAAAQEHAGGGLGAAHQALLHREGPTGFQPYERPQWFVARLIGLMTFVCISLVIASVIALTLPVWLGRKVMAVWLVGAPPPAPHIAINSSSESPAVSARVHELYTASCGTYICWVAARALSLVLSWLPQGRAAMMAKLKQWCLLGTKTIIASIVLLGIIPLLFGLLLELVVVIPLRVPLEQTPVLFVWQDWALGVLYTKIACAVTMMGPDWTLRAAIEKAYRDGIRDMDLKFILWELAAPVIVCFGLALAIPYVTAHSFVPLLISSPQMKNLIARRLYPFLLLIGLIGAVITFQIKQFQKLYEHIKNDKYLVGQRLVNYDHRRQKSQTTSVAH